VHTVAAQCRTGTSAESVDREYTAWLDDHLRGIVFAEENCAARRAIDIRVSAVSAQHSRQYDRAIAQFRAVREMDPTFPRTGVIRFAYVQKRLFTNALEEIEKWRHVYGDQPWTWSELAYIDGKSGQQAQAEHALQKLLQLDQRQPVDPAAIVWAYLGTGNKEQALAYLEKAYLQHSAILATLRVEPGFDPLRSDPRYQDLVRRVGLAQ